MKPYHKDDESLEHFTTDQQHLSAKSQYVQSAIKNRKCTDVICFIIWIGFWLTLIVFSIIGFVKGDIDNIAQPYDSDGTPCGRGDLKEYQFLYINEPYSTHYYKNMVCVRRCPATEESKVECYPNTDIKSCDDIKSYESYGFVSRICIPRNPVLTNAVKSHVNISKYQESLEEIQSSWPILITVLILSILICFLFYFLLENCAFVMIFFMLFGSLAGLIGFGVFSWFKYKNLIKQSVYNEDIASSYRTTAIVCWVLGGIFFLFILCLFSQIKLAAKMIAAAADFIGERKRTLLVPILLTLTIGLFLLIWIVCFAFIFSTGQLRYDEGDVFGDMTWSDQIYAAVYMMIFGLLWFLAFIISTNIFVTACICASWYFQRSDNKDEVGIFQALRWAWFTNLGSLAFGSFFIAVLWFIQLILSYIYSKLKESQNVQSAALLKCIMCFTACFEKFLKFLNQHAYIEVALKSTNFCSSIQKCVSIMAEYFMLMTALTGLVNLFLYLGTILIAFFITIIGYYMLQWYGSSTNEVYDTIGPILLIFLIAVTVSCLFNDIFEIAADTMLHCYIFEDQHSSKSQRKDNHCPHKMKDIIQDVQAYKKIKDQFNQIFIQIFYQNQQCILQRKVIQVKYLQNLSLIHLIFQWMMKIQVIQQILT